MMMMMVRSLWLTWREKKLHISYLCNQNFYVWIFWFTIYFALLYFILSVLFHGVQGWQITCFNNNNNNNNRSWWIVIGSDIFFSLVSYYKHLLYVIINVTIYCIIIVKTFIDFFSGRGGGGGLLLTCVCIIHRQYK